MPERVVHFITGNKNKLEEVQAILGHLVVVKNTPLDLVEVQGTIDQVTLEKSKRAAEAIRGPVLVEDTSLCFKALNDLPGPYMLKWFLDALGHEGLNKMLIGFDSTEAEAVATFGYCKGPGSPPTLFQGRCPVRQSQSMQQDGSSEVADISKGKIVSPRGPANFGWDPIFEYSGTGLTFAEMDKAEKNKISHRRLALDKLKDWLEAQTEH